MARYIDAVKCAEVISEKLNIPLDNLVDVFAEIPTADVAEVKHGEWVQEWEPQQLLDDYDETPYVKCSICGHEEWYIDKESGNAPNYCEDCGAKMDGK